MSIQQLIRQGGLLDHDMMPFAIDVVIPWVDDGDPAWRAERDAYLATDGLQQGQHMFDAGIDRYRSWDSLQFIFRGIEEFMPWVRKIHLVTNGQVPYWLDLTHPKLNHVTHADYIPREYLPTFNSHAIELNLHRIPDLAEHFIYFNDDTFVIRPLKPTDFFSRDGLPRDQFGLWRVKATKYDSVLPHVYLNNMAVLNQNFKQSDVLQEEYKRLLHLRNGAIRLTLTVLMSVISQKDFANMLFHHMPAAFLKQSFREVWATEPEILASTSSHRFRSKDDVSQYLIRAWQMINGNFEPRNVAACSEHFTYITDDFTILTDAIRTRRLKLKKLEMFCVSDEKITDFERAKVEINKALRTVMPEKSTFEIRHRAEDQPKTAARPSRVKSLNNKPVLQAT